MDRTKYTVTKYLDGKKTNRAINIAFIKQLLYIDDSVYKVEHVKAEIDHRESKIVRFFILQNSMLRMLELYYNFFKQYCDESKFEELEMGTDSLDIALAESDNIVCIRQDKLGDWSAIRKEDCCDNSEAYNLRNFFLRTCCSTHSQLDQ